MQIPFQVLQHLQDPERFERLLMAYFKKAKLPFDQQKTIAAIDYYDQRNLTGDEVVTFFSGTFDQNNTNLIGDFRKPQSEHSIVWGIRLWQGQNAPVENTEWLAGITDSQIQNAKMTIIVNNATKLKNWSLADAIREIITKDVGYFELPEPIIWPGQTDMTITVSSVSGAFNVPDINLRVQLVGIGLI